MRHYIDRLLSSTCTGRNISQITGEGSCKYGIYIKPLNSIWLDEDIPDLELRWTKRRTKYDEGVSSSLSLQRRGVLPANIGTSKPALLRYEVAGKEELSPKDVVLDTALLTGLSPEYTVHMHLLDTDLDLQTNE